MGNGNAKSASGLEDAVREYASKYILRASFQDMVSMSDRNFCKELIILTSELLDSKMSSTEIEVIDNMKKGNSGKPKRAKVYYATVNKVNTSALRLSSISCRNASWIGGALGNTTKWRGSRLQASPHTRSLRRTPRASMVWSAAPMASSAICRSITKLERYSRQCFAKWHKVSMATTHNHKVSNRSRQ